MSKTAIIITTFLRDELLKSTVDSVVRNNPDNNLILIGDQNPSESKENKYNSMPNCVYIPQTYDIGLSASRNQLVRVAEAFECDYCVISADSIQFNFHYVFYKIINFMNWSSIDRIGFRLNNRVKWEFMLELIPGKFFRLMLPETSVESSIGKLTQVDICKNFFITKTETLLNVTWDDELKLMEHEDWSWRYKNAGYKTYVTDYISANYIDCKPALYKIMRSRMYGEYTQKLKEKYRISQWINYGPGVLDSIKKG